MFTTSKIRHKPLPTLPVIGGVGKGSYVVYYLSTGSKVLYQDVDLIDGLELK